MAYAGFRLRSVTSPTGPDDERVVKLDTNKDQRDTVHLYESAQEMQARLQTSGYETVYSTRGALTRLALVVPTLGICSTPKCYITVKPSTGQPIDAEISLTRRKARANVKHAKDPALFQAFIAAAFR